MLESSEYIDLVLEYGPEGQTSEGRAPTYFLDDRVVSLSDLCCDRLEENIQTLKSAGIPVPETEYKEVEIPVYGLGEKTVVEQRRIDEPGPECFVNRDENIWVEQLREFGRRAASENIRIDFGLDNFGLADGQLFYYDIQDEESVWTDEELSFHLMGNYLDRSIRRLQREASLRAPKTQEMAETWKNIK